jgi:hypothetical protein
VTSYEQIRCQLKEQGAKQDGGKERCGVERTVKGSGRTVSLEKNSSSSRDGNSDNGENGGRLTVARLTVAERKSNRTVQRGNGDATEG